MEETLDQILALQIKIARLGESDQMAWWRVDATAPDSGGDFFLRLLGSQWQFGAIEAVLHAAQLREYTSVIQAGSFEMITLFHPPAQIKRQLAERWQHFKAQPDTLTAALQPLFLSDWQDNLTAFKAELDKFTRPSFEHSTLGRKRRGAVPENPLTLMQELAALLLPLEKGHYPMPYCPVA